MVLCVPVGVVSATALSLGPSTMVKLTRNCNTHVFPCTNAFASASLLRVKRASTQRTACTIILVAVVGLRTHRIVATHCIASVHWFLLQREGSTAAA